MPKSEEWNLPGFPIQRGSTGGPNEPLFLSFLTSTLAAESCTSTPKEHPYFTHINRIFFFPLRRRPPPGSDATSHEAHSLL